MERLLGKKRWTALLFFILLFAYAFVNAKKELPVLIETITSFDSDLSASEKINQIDSSINENAMERYAFVDAYGYLQRLLNKNEESNFEVVKDTVGKLHYTYFTTEPQDTSELVERVRNLADAVETKKTKVIYVLPPDKYIRGYTTFAKGIPYHMSNETADGFLAGLEENGIPYLDLRENLSESGRDLSEAFYVTDHHWTIQTAFWAAGELSDWLNESFGEDLDADDFYKDESNYNEITYDKISLGSMGRKTGRYYAGVDDFTLIYPKFDTSYVYENTIEPDLTFQGRFEEALMATPVIRQSSKPFDTDMYMTYLYGNPAFSHIVNEKETGSIDVCFIKDSFAVPFAAFTSLRCHTVDMIDPRYFTGDYEETINEGNYDYVIIMISPQDLVEEFFPYGK